ncbi:cathepsin W [Sorex araneus]|uniref:cathepsin W n=1 Tax=Sorex araneus TaxID=42254 RepID=UPI002433AADB|nr:cathepsin W [Sorex araneus]
MLHLSDSTMELTGARACLLALCLAGLVPGIQGSVQGQDPGERPLELKEVFALFQAQYNRSYPSATEHARRLAIFARNLERAQQLQEEALGTAEFGVTPFSDLTEEEFGQLYGHRTAAAGPPQVNAKAVAEEWGTPVPLSCNWTKAGVISPIREQKQCKCCWAMAAADNIEALWAIGYQRKVSVSVQELLDCDRCGNGCQGGFVWDAFYTVLNNSGLASEHDYPFKGDRQAHRCRAREHRKVAWIEDFVMLPRNESNMASYLATHGPITVTINMKLLQLYTGGVIMATASECDPRMVDHVVLLVGFGKGSGRAATALRPRPRQSRPYWLLKNSWGDKWGEKGYFRLHRGSNTCGIKKFPLTALLHKPKRHSCPR